MGTGRRLLLADDSITIQKVVNLTFADEGMEVVTVGNGDLAVEKIEDLSPDIVLADIHMPGLNGYEVCEFVKRNARFRHIPVMLLVGSFEPFNEAEARRVGADDYLTKPFQSIKQLVSKVGSLLGGKPAAEDEAPTKDLEQPAEAHVASEDRADGALTPTAPLNEEPWGGMEDRGLVRADDFADPGLDDAMIEATPAVEYNMHRTVGSQQRPTMPLTATDLEEAGVNLNQTSPNQDFNQTSPMNMQETLRMHEPEQEDIQQESSRQQFEPSLETPLAMPSAPSVARHKEAVSSADDALLDLDEIEPAPRAAADSGADDFVLDLWDDAPAQEEEAAAPRFEAAPALDVDDAIEPPLAAAEFVEAEVIEAEPIVEAEPVEEPRREEAQSVEAQSVEAVPLSAEPAAETSAAQAQTGQITLDQLAPEAIDAIARRAVEMLSEKVVEQVAWEVVPDLAELIIKRRLEEERARNR